MAATTRLPQWHLLRARTIQLLLLGVILTVAMKSTIGEAAMRPPNVQINKCCRIGEHLERTKLCVAGGMKNWAPVVYMIKKEATHEPRGSLPRFFTVKESTRPSTCDDPEVYFDHAGMAIFSNGSLYLAEKSLFIAMEDFCVDKDAALICFPQIHGTDSLIAPKSKVRKCCGRNMVYDEVNRTCLFLKETDHPLRNAAVINSSNVEIIYGFPPCNNTYVNPGQFHKEFVNEETGTATLDTGKKFQSGDFCLEHKINLVEDARREISSVNIFACSDHYSNPDQFPEVPAKKDNVTNILYSIGLLISVIFLMATLGAGFLMPSNHHVLHWRCQTYYVACLLVGDLLLAISQIAANAINGPPCVAMAFFMHFFFLAAFFWLNTMCFNIWWTFRDFRPTSLEKGQELFRLRIYQVYAWGVPSIISGLAAIFHFIPAGPDDKILRPRFGEKTCWFSGDMEIFTYFFGPLAVLLCINLLLFASTARQLTCGLWKRDDVKSTTERAALGRVCLKLVIVMGITWIADIISWLVGGPSYAWYITDLINALQGVFIFIVVGCQPQVWSAIKRIWSSKTGRGVTNTTNGPQHSSSSHGLPSIGESVTNNTLTNTTSTKVPMETIC